MTEPNKIPVLLWLYNTELYQEFVELLIPLKKHIHIYLGLCDTTQYSEALSVFRSEFHHELSVEWYPNEGADVLPFLYQLEHIAHKNYRILIKIHSKKSFWGYKQHVNWRSVLLNDLLNPSMFFCGVRQLLNRTEVMLGPRGLLYRNNEYTNSEKIKQICNELKMSFSSKQKLFIGGNMFMAKKHVFDVILKHKDYLYPLLQQEKGKIDDSFQGTYCHSLERIFGYLAQRLGGITYVFNDKTIILSPKSKLHRLHLIKLYNNYCYLEENPNIYGYIEASDHEQTVIKWFNQDQPNIQTYTNCNNKLINYAYT